MAVSHMRNKNTKIRYITLVIGTIWSMCSCYEADITQWRNYELGGPLGTITASLWPIPLIPLNPARGPCVHDCI